MVHCEHILKGATVGKAWLEIAESIWLEVSNHIPGSVW